MRGISALLVGLTATAPGCSLVLSDGDDEPEVETVVLNRDVTSVVDTWLWEGMPELDNSLDDILLWDTDHGDPPFEGAAAALLRFELSPDLIPESAEIVAARLLLVVADNGDPAQLAVMRIPWDPTDTWSTISGGAGLAEVDVTRLPVSVLSPTEGLPVTTDVTDSVIAWHVGEIANNGWAFLADQSNGAEVYSSENAFVELVPTLEVDIIRAR